MELLERKKHLDELDGLHRQATARHGHLLFLGGEAGVGKSALVLQFADQVQLSTRVLTGSCDPLSTPRPLGPLIDIAEVAGGEVASRLQASMPRADVFKAVLAELAAHPITLVVIEDAHWADEATLDLLRYLGRRLAPVPALIIVTYRDDEVGPGHPLRRVLGDLATASAVRRLALEPLSLEAVRDLARESDFDPIELHRLTGGNPFFITEVLALGEAGLPSTVRDAVLARASRLTLEGRRALEICAVIGPSIEPSLLERVAVAAAPVAECIEHGMLIRSGSNLAFRHEIARQAVLETMSPVSRMELHRNVLAALRLASSQDLAALAHHAEEAGDREAVLEFAPAAAERAAALRSHREAASQYERALRFAHSLPRERRASLLEARSYECYLTGQLVEAIAAGEAALDIWRGTGDRLREGDALRKLSRLFSVSGRNLEASGAGLKAIRILETLPAGPELAMAYSNLAQLRMRAWYQEEAISWGTKAIALSERLGELGTLIHALTNVGASHFLLENEQGRHEMERSLALAREHGFDEHAARAIACLGPGYCERYQFALADPYLGEGIDYCAERDLDFMRMYLLSWQSVSFLYQGRWAEATAVAESILIQSQRSPIPRIITLAALGRTQARQGNPQAAVTLDRALELVSPMGHLQRLGPVRTARAEAAWLAGDRDTALVEATDHYENAVMRKHRWLVGELAFWRWRAGDLDTPPDGAFEPYALQITGNWKDAAAHWRALGCPYETASALTDSDDEADLRYALAEFNRLGAAPMADIVSARLREKTQHRIRHRTPLPAAVATTPETRYAKSGDVHIAYQVIGDGPIDLVFVMGWISNLELFWEGPSAAFLRRLASFSRLIIFDKRGTGLSDKVSALPTIEQRMDDVRAVMDAAGSERAVLFGISEGAAMCAVFAATFPHKTSALVIYGGYAKRVWAPDYPWAPTPAERQAFYHAIEHGWGGVVDLDTLAPSAAVDPRFREWWASYLRRSASPGAALELAKMNTEIDIRAILPSIRVPTLILHRIGDLDIAVGGARYLAEHIPDATYIELPGNDHLVFAGNQEAILDEIELFLSATIQIPTGDRVLATIVSLAQGGPDRADSPAGYLKTPAAIDAWRRDVEQALAEYRGNLIQFRDGRVLTSFDGPGRAIRFACALAEALDRRGMTISAGLHTGECVVIDGTLGGAPIDIATEIMSSCAPGEIVVASTVKDLVAGSGVAFEPAGRLTAREFPDGLPLHRVVIDQAQPATGLESRPRVVREREAPVQLSKRETEIAALIAGGLSNRQIAGELSISPATAERHVSNIFNKLGYHSRAQIAAWAVEHELTAGNP